MIDLDDRFWSKVRKIPGGCWEWVGGTGGGRPGCTYGSFRGKRVHRLLYEDCYGVSLGKNQIHHICRNKLCVNPIHLQLISAKDHADKFDSAASIHRAKRFCPRGHEYAGDNLILGKRKSGSIHRMCSKCISLNRKRLYSMDKSKIIARVRDRRASNREAINARSLELYHLNKGQINSRRREQRAIKRLEAVCD